MAARKSLVRKKIADTICRAIIQGVISGLYIRSSSFILANSKVEKPCCNRVAATLYPWAWKTRENTAPVASRQRAHRSAVSNGTRLFCVDGLDGRSQTARRFRDLVETIGNDLGGVDHLSEGQKQLIRRAATLSIMAEAMEADAVRNLAFDGEAYGVLCDRLGRCLQRLGLERKPRDVTPTLQSYLAAKAQP